MMQKSKSDLNLSKNNRTTSDYDGIELEEKEKKIVERKFLRQSLLLMVYNDTFFLFISLRFSTDQ